MKINDNEINWEVPAEDRPYYLDIDGKKIYVSEEIYRSYKQPFWAEHKRKERESRCMVSNGKGGLKRCTDSCEGCPFFRSNSILSIDKFYEDSEFEMVDRSESILEKLAKEELYEKQREAVAELDTLDQQIITLFMDGLSERAIAEKVNLSQKAINKRKNRIFDELREKLKDFK